MDKTPSIAEQTVRGSFYTTLASGVTITLGFMRAVLLARFLLPEHFGTVALAMVFVILGNRLRSLGFHVAILHKQDDRGPYYTTFFTLHTLLVLISSFLYILVSPLIAHFYPEQHNLTPVMMALIAITGLGAMNQIQETLMRVHLRFDRLALTNVASAIAMFLVAPYLAWRGWGVWSLVAQEGSGILMRAILVWGPWRIGAVRFGVDKEAARWLLRFGAANWVGANTNYLLERFDDFWVGTDLGRVSLGFYNRAYEFARYPRRLIATSLVTVMTPVFARLQSDMAQLSRAFFRVMSLLVRVGLAFGGLILLLTPEFVHYVLGPKWDPMILTLQLMTLYMVLDPLVIMSSNLFFALGQPEVIARVRLVQLALFLPAVVAGAKVASINGVALAADAMLFIGLVLTLRRARKVVTFSLWRMMGWPLLASGVGIALPLALVGYNSLLTPGAGWTVIAKAVLFVAAYGGVLLVGEGKEVREMVRYVYVLTRRQGEKA